MSRLRKGVFVRSCFFGSFWKYILLLGCMSVLSSMSFKDVYAKQVRHSTMSPEELVGYYRNLRSGRHPVLTESSYDSIPSDKCGLWITAQLLDQWKNLTAIQRQEIQTLIRQHSSQYDKIIGHFRIFYDLSGPNTPMLFDGTGKQIGDALAYVDSVGAIFNHVWNIEIDSLGFQQPPFESGDSCYNISISDRGDGDYGITNTVDLISGTQIPERYSSNIDIDNDFIGSNYTSKGIQALRVTAAHEFHHAIQYGYGWWEDNEIYAYELTSTWMEDVVYTDVNDYYQYLLDYFVGFHDGLSFNSGNYRGYERCILAHFLAKRYGISIMKDVWTAMRTQPFLESLDAVLLGRGSSLQAAFGEFTYWNYFTADRADTVKYYPEGNHYPRFQPLQQKSFRQTTDSIGGDVYSLSSSMYEFDLPSDTITSMIANVEVGSAEQRDITTRRVDVTLSSDIPLPPYQEFSNYGLMAKVIVADTSLWHSFFSQGVRHDTVINPPRFVVSSDASPNPFRLMYSQQLLLPIHDVAARTAEVYFYSPSLNLAYSKSLPVSIAGPNRVIAVPSSELKSNLSSGIYLIIAKTKNNEYRWKVAVIR